MSPDPNSIRFDGDIRAWNDRLNRADTLRAELEEEDDQPMPTPALLSLIGQKKSDFENALNEESASEQFERDRNAPEEAVTESLQQEIRQQEESEANVLGDIPLTQMKRSMLWSLVKPCLLDGKVGNQHFILFKH